MLSLEATAGVVEISFLYLLFFYPGSFHYLEPVCIVPPQQPCHSEQTYMSIMYRVEVLNQTAFVFTSSMWGGFHQKNSSFKLNVNAVPFFIPDSSLKQETESLGTINR